MFRLATKDGDHVADVQVPTFQKLPDVLIWGDRIFQFHQDITTADDPCSAEYRECFAFMVPIPLPDRAASPAFDKVTDPTKPPVTTEANKK
jgi:hypothetical protein